ncbi:unnamed protein product [Hermetia illucens]|uniref:Uncharacterized protein n=1 Tax=Hermetia illucens TaxID=343691 RepID=A0A7R8V3C0_HERIL|nr:DDB1- and CUL4-associated factor 10 homolog isoform X1 [Hermetia illucens]CAD7091242.1 unnamed protein product [Hermetia illucens]
MTFYKWLQRREHGFRPVLGDEDFVHKCIYNSFKLYKTWNSCGKTGNSDFGGIFNLEFSPDGNLLVAACEKKSIGLFDPVTTKHTKTINNAHLDSVNCIKFLDNRIFATCSDDTTVAIWDTRNLKKKIRSLQGHSNWVKNIEYSQKDGLLVTSGFDGSIFTWDINSYTEQGFIYHKVFHTSGLMRCRISPDASKMVICTTGGYLIIIHDLDLTTLAKDLCGFRPNIYRLMQLGRQFIPQAAKFDHVFSKTQKRNRVELISDFPERNDAEVVCALQIHPHGWCVLSRNISYDEGSEWSCIHDILEKEEEDYLPNEQVKKRKLSESDDLSPTSNRAGNSSFSSSNFESTSNQNESETNRGSTNNRNEALVPDIWAAEVTVQDRACRIHQRRYRDSNSTNAYAYVYAISSGVIPQSSLRSSVSRRSNLSAASTDGETSNPEDQEPQSPVQINYMSFCNRKIYQNVSRLLYYIEEPNKGRGFIKEPSFSADGRIICSPYEEGFRLLAFNEDCSELPIACDSPQKNPKQLKVIKSVTCHSDIVVSTKFSPRYPLLVSGCLRGKIVWHHPDF